MLHLKIDTALYSELDFPHFNPRGFARVHEAVTLAFQRRHLAQSAEELREATQLLRLANDIKNAEQQVAQKNFEIERAKAFAALSNNANRVARLQLPTTKRREIENRLDHLITLFNLKEFGAVRRKAGALLKEADGAPTQKKLNVHGFRRPSRTAAGPRGGDAPFKHGLALERAGRLREAVEIYGQVVRHNPRHRQAMDRLREIGNVIEHMRAPKQRRQSWTRKYRRYAG